MMADMTQSKRSIYAQTAAGWIFYQRHYLGIAEEDLQVEFPQQFSDIFMVGYALGEERGSRA